MKVLFLDIDGVINSTRTALAFGGYPMELDHLGAFDQVALRMLHALCRAGEVQIVLSSAWRIGRKAEAVGIALGLPIVDSTPILPFTRGHEIAEWLKAHPEVAHYAIVDDDSDMLPEQMPRFVKTDHFNGLMWSDYLKLCSLLDVDPYQGQTRDRNWRMPGRHLQWDDEVTYG